MASSPDLAPSFIRTLVPLIVGYLVSLGARYGFDINDDQAASLITVGATYAYYVVVRYLETHSNSRFGWLLGSARTPTYVTPPAQVIDDGSSYTVEAPEDDGQVWSADPGSETAFRPPM